LNSTNFEKRREEVGFDHQRKTMAPALSLRRTLALLVASATIASAKPYPRDDLHDAGMGYLMPRDCDSYCGSDNQMCCGENESCVTMEGDVATCAGGGGSYPAGTTTWTETRTFTSTIMTWWEPVPEPTEGVDCVPKDDTQEQCGPICCAGWQTCAFNGQCSARPGYDEPSTIIITTDGKTTTQYSAPYRITGTTTVTEETTVTEGATSTETTSEPTSTETSEPIGAGGGGGGGLSGGAIAGIVIGSIAGAMLLLLLAFCCIARGLWNACFGRKKKERTEVYEERYSRHGSRPPSAHSRRKNHTGWFGGGGSAAGSEKKSSGKRWLGLAGLAATLLALLNMKKEKKPARKGGGRSRYSDSYYSYSDYTSPSSSSSGRRTHRTGSRGPTSHYTKTSRRS
jgi:hypothetical protein